MTIVALAALTVAAPLTAKTVIASVRVMVHVPLPMLSVTPAPEELKFVTVTSTLFVAASRVPAETVSPLGAVGETKLSANVYVPPGAVITSAVTHPVKPALVIVFALRADGIQLNPPVTVIPGLIIRLP